MGLVDKIRKSIVKGPKKSRTLFLGGLITSFVLSVLVSVWSLNIMATDNTKAMDMLLTARIYDNLNSVITEPVNVSKTMSATQSLKEVLTHEEGLDEASEAQFMANYLLGLKNSFGYETVFVVSEKTKRYYTYEGMMKTLDPVHNEYDRWYSSFVDSNLDYDMSVDRDTLMPDRWTVFVNTRVVDQDGRLLGVCGVGVKITDLQDIFAEMEEKYQVKILLVDKNGQIQVDTDEDNIEQFLASDDASRTETSEGYIYSVHDNGDFTVTKYVDNLHWYLVVISENIITNPDFIKIIVLNIGLFLLMILVFFFISYRLLAKYDINEMKSRNLNERMAAAAQIYYEFKEVDIINNTIRPVIVRDEASGELKADGNGAQQVFWDYVEDEVEEHFKLQMKEFVDFSILGLMLEYRVAAATTFMTRQGKWLRARVVRCQQTPAGKVATFLWILEDISEERQQRDALIDVSNRVAAANNAKTAFLSTISNELRAPIDAVLGINSMILAETREPQTIRYSESIRDASVDLLGRINDILDFSNIEAGKLEIVPREYDFRELLNELVTMIRPKAEEKGLSFVLDIDGNIPKGLFGDDIRIKQIFINLLTNAVKYTAKGRVMLAIGAERLDDEHIGLHVSVKDTGQGIKDEDKSRLFVEFERVEEGRSPTVGGTGLGVTITQRLLGLMGSNLEVESVYKLGSNFYFALEQRVLDWTSIGEISDIVAPVADEEVHLPRFIYDLPEINVEAGIKNNGDEEAYLEALKVYASMVGTYIDEITQYMQEKDIENATIKIHALKSTSRIIGAEGIGEQALALETAGRAGDMATLEKNVAGLLERCGKLGEQLRPLVENTTEAAGEEKAMIDGAVLAQAYGKIGKYALGCDSLGIEEVLGELNHYQLPEEEQAKISALAQAIDNFDFERVSEILQEE